MKVFLGGSLAGPDWRNTITPLLMAENIKSFNPAGDKTMGEIYRQKVDCNCYMYVITKEASDNLNIAEAVQSAMMPGKKCFFHVFTEGFDLDELTDILEVMRLIQRSGGVTSASDKDATRPFRYTVKQLKAYGNDTKLRVGQYFKHKKGRAIAIVGEVQSQKFGPMFAVEETDVTGHSVSCIEKDSILGGNWVEIGKVEWDKAYRKSLPKRKEIRDA